MSNSLFSDQIAKYPLFNDSGSWDEEYDKKLKIILLVTDKDDVDADEEVETH